MKKIVLSILILSLFFIPLNANAWFTNDIKPVAIGAEVGLDDDAIMSYSQHVYIYVKNIGNYKYENTDFIKVRVGDTESNCSVYGLREGNTSCYTLHTPIYPGKTGLIFLRLPLDTLRTCQYVNVRIDVDRNTQFGFLVDVFRNDWARLIVNFSDCFYPFPVNNYPYVRLEEF
ncbi:MAG: hypothetical protein ACMUIU_03415 [bacterium]